jgi:surface protein
LINERNIIADSTHKLKRKRYEPELWEEIINYTATILNPNLAMINDNSDYVAHDDTSQLYTPLPKFNDGFTQYKYKQTLNDDGTVTVSIIIDKIKNIRPTQIKFGDYNNDQGATEVTKALLRIDKLDTKGMVTAVDMFLNCINLNYINTDLIDTSKVSNMQFMFNKCSALTQLDVSNWNTSSVTTMQAMFYDCNKLASLDVSGWITSSVTTMKYMFKLIPNCQLILGANFIMSQNPTTTNMFAINDDNTQFKSRTTIDMTACPQDTQNKITAITAA